MKSTISLLALCIGLAVSGEAAAASTATDGGYCDTKRLYCFEYPKGWMTQLHPADFKDGAVFKSKDGNTLFVTIVESKTVGESVKSKMNEFLKSYAGDVIKSKSSDSSQYVVTGVHKGQVFYERMIMNLSKQLFVHLYIVTTPTYAAAHAGELRKISDSLGVIDLSGLKAPVIPAGTTDTPPPLTSRPKTSAELAIKAFTGLDYYGVGSSKYYTTRRTRMTTGEDQFEIRMMYTPTLDSNTWGQCSVTFPPTPVQLTATRREPAQPGLVIADGLVGGTKPVVIEIHMGTDARCWYEMH